MTVHQLHSVPTAGRREAKKDPVAELISSLVNSGIYNPGDYGITDDMIYAHTRVHEFCKKHQLVTGEAPSPEVLMSRHYDFPYNPMQHIKMAVENLRAEYAQREFSRLLNKSANLVVAGSLEEAQTTLSEGMAKLPRRERKPVNAMDPEFILPTAPVPAPVWGTTLQNLTGGIRPGEVWYLGARPGRGKSWELAMHAIEASQAGWDVLIYSLEMPAADVIARIHSVIVDSSPGAPPKQDQLMTMVANGAGLIHVHDVSTATCDPTTVHASAREGQLTIVDYVGLMKTKTGERSVDDYRFASAISNSLKETAVSRHCPVMAAVQLNRTGESSSRPSLAEMSQTDDYGRDADLVYFIRSEPGSIVQHKQVIKFRRGPAGVQWFTEFQPGIPSFREINRERAEEIRAIEIRG